MHLYRRRSREKVAVSTLAGPAVAKRTAHGSFEMDRLIHSSPLPMASQAEAALDGLERRSEPLDSARLRGTSRGHPHEHGFASTQTSQRLSPALETTREEAK